MLGGLGRDLARKAEDAVLDQIVGTNLLLRKTLRRKAELLRAELGGPRSSALEMLVADGVVASWLQVHYAEALLGQPQGLAFAQSDSWQWRIDHVHRRLLSAKAPEATRGMALPVMLAQVNVAAAVPPRSSPA